MQVIKHKQKGIDFSMGTVSIYFHYYLEVYYFYHSNMANNLSLVLGKVIRFEQLFSFQVFTAVIL